METNTPLTTEVSSAEMNNFLTRRLGEKEATEVMVYIDKEIDRRTEARIGNTKTEMRNWKEELYSKIHSRVSKAENTMILWGFVFWLTGLVAIYCFLRFF
jgi:hypothetical protein